VLFCASDERDFDWETIGAVANELIELGKNSGHLPAMRRLLESEASRQTLTDVLLEQPKQPLCDSLKSALIGATANLKEGDHDYFTVDADGGFTNRTRENLATVPEPLRASPIPPPIPIPSNPPKREKPSILMRTFVTHSICLMLGVVLGLYLYSKHFEAKPPQEKPPPKQKIYTSDEDALDGIRAATEYLARSLSGQLSKPGPSNVPRQPDRFGPSENR